MSEQLEARVLLAADFAAIAAKVDAGLTIADATADALKPAASLPVINRSLATYEQAKKDVILPIRDKLKVVLAALQSSPAPAAMSAAAAPSAAASDVAAAVSAGQIRAAVFKGLGTELKVLADDDKSGAVNANDVFVKLGPGDDVTIRVDLAKQLVKQSVPFDLGLPGIPLSAKTQVDFGLGFGLDNLTFGWRNGAAFFGGAPAPSADATRLRFDLTGQLPKVTGKPSIEGTAGFLKFKATNLNPGPELKVSYAQPLSATGAAAAPVLLDGRADVRLRLEATVAGSASAPSMNADFGLDWNLGGFVLDGAAVGSKPTVKFTNVQLGLGSYLSKSVAPVVDRLQTLIKPVQPVLDVVTAPVPVLSDLTEAVGLGETSLLDIAEVAAGVGGLPPQVQLVLELAVEAAKIGKLVSSLNTVGNDVFLNLGEFDLSAGGVDVRGLKKFDYKNPQQTVLQFAAKLGDKVADQIAKVSGPVGDVARGLLKAYSEQQTTAGFDLAFPLFDDPTLAFGLLVGRDVDLVRFDAFARGGGGYGEPLPAGPVSVKFKGTATFDARVTLGYDTLGLRRVFNAAEGASLVDGFYIGGNTGADLTGTLEAEAALTALVFSAGVSGSITLNAGLKLASPVKDIDGNQTVSFQGNPFAKVRLPELGDTLFNVGGGVSASLDVFARIGVELPIVGFVGHEERFNIAGGTLFKFGFSAVPNPYKQPGPPELASVVNGELRLHAGPLAGKRAGFIGKADVAEQFTVNRNPGDDKQLDVTAFGFTQSFPVSLVKTVRADGGNGDDVFEVADDLNLAIQMTGGAGNDTLRYRGAGTTSMAGDGGNDVLEGGTGLVGLIGGDGNDSLTANSPEAPAPANSVNVLLGGAGNDTLVGAANRRNQFVGGAGDDLIAAGDKDDVAFGDDLGTGNDTTGNDQFTAGAGRLTASGGPGDDRVAWEAGDGAVTFAGGGSASFPQSDAFLLLGGDAAETIAVARSTTAGSDATVAIQPAGGPAVTHLLAGVEAVDLGGRGGADTIAVADLSNTAVRSVGVNLGDITDLDFATDKVAVVGTPAADAILLESEGVQSVDAPDRFKADAGVTRITGLKSYTVRVANVADFLQVSAQGGNDAVAVAGITGPTLVAGDAGDDLMTAGVVPSATIPPPGKVFAAALQVDAGSGAKNAFLFIDQTPTGATVTLTDADAKSAAVPLGVTFKATNGAYGNGVGVLTGAGPDTVAVRSTLAGLPTFVRTSGGSDTVNVGSADGATATLAQVRAALAIDGEAGFNTVGLRDQGATSGNGNVVVGANTVTGFAGPSDAVPVVYTSTGGSTALALEGSNAAGLAESFTLNSPAAVATVFANGGPDKLFARSLTSSANLFGGAGDDAITFGSTPGLLPDHTLAGLASGIVPSADGGPGFDTVNVFDQGAAAGRTFALGPNQLAFGGVTLKFAVAEVLDVRGGKADDVFKINGLPAAPLTTRFVGGGAATTGVGNQVIGPDAATTWNLTGAQAGNVAGRVAFNQVSTVLGGTAHDTFAVAPGASTNLQVFGGAGADALDYTAWTTPVTVDLAAVTATGVKAAFNVANALGGKSDDLLRGDGAINILAGGDGNDILVGREGGDQVNGGNGRDLVIGGKGFDQVVGGADDDIVIAGYTAHDESPTALASIRTRWVAATAGYEARVDSIRGGRGGSDLPVLTSTTVVVDASTDAVAGGGGRDWFWASAAGLTSDTILDRTRSEFLN